jgi:hypothetical protein
MRFSSLLSSAARNPLQNVQLALLLTSFAQISTAISFNPAPSANLDLSQLGRVGLAGDFDGISLYEFEGQNENGISKNGTQSILARYPNGAFATLASSDGSINAMCPFVLMDGTMAGIVVAGNFTSFGGTETQGVALFNPNTSAITPLTGISGQVTALYCDKTSNTVYVGGSFKGANSTNAVAWVGTAGWTNLPFNGFNGPVASITKVSNGHIIFGGTFTSLGNASTPNNPDELIIPISSGSISAGSSAATIGFSDPRNIVCKTSGADGSGITWLLADNSPGYWRAEFRFGFVPTKLRLWNTHQDGRGTKTWRYTNSIGGIMNLTYTDPSSGATASCSSECPLSNNPSTPYQDFHFVNPVGMNSFQIDISAWYGNGGGLNGIELFEDDIFTYAINSFNEPTCANIKSASKSTTTGPWITIAATNNQTQSDYLSVVLNGTTIDPSSASIVFYPDIKQSGNYSVNMYTPGCLQDNTCSTRGRINITMATSNNTANANFQTEIYQTNNFAKYDQIYFGYVDAASDSFRPSITISPSSGQSSSLTMVAHRIGFTLTSHSGGLNSLFEYDPSQAVVNTDDWANSTFDKAGVSLQGGADVRVLATVNDTTYVAGNFSSTTYDNIFAVTKTGPAALAGGGLNSHVTTMFLNGTTLYVGGNFTDTSKSSTSGLNNIAVYDISKNAWTPLGNGVNGRVNNIVPLAMNLTGSSPETVITVTGNFDQILASGGNQSLTVAGFAVWVPSRSNWLQNIDVNTPSMNGQLSFAVDLPSGNTLYAGSLSSEAVRANGVASLSSGLGRFPINIQPSQKQTQGGALRKRATNATNSQNITGVVTGLFDEASGRNLTILGGHFIATSSNGSVINNLVFINGSNSNAVTGIGSQLSNDSTILTLAVTNDTLYAGGDLTGTVGGNKVNGLISYDLRNGALNTQPPALAGDNVAVYAIAVRPTSSDIYIGGSFSKAGSLDCPGVCVFSSSASQWNRPGNSLTGTVNAMTWASTNSLVVAGSLTVGGVNNTYVATYDAPSQVWSTLNGANTLPGPVTALAPATSDASQLWVAGTASNGSTFLSKYDGSMWNAAGYTLGAGSTIRGLQVLSLTQNHDSTNLVPSSQALMLTGSLNVPGYGNASAVIFNGTTFQPYALTSSGLNSAGSISQIFFQQQNVFTSSGMKYMTSVLSNPGDQD